MDIIVNSCINKKTPLFRQVYHDLLRTEEEFVGELRFVIDNYVSAIKNPSAPQGVSNLGGRLVLNLRELYTFHSKLFFKYRSAKMGACFLF